MTGELVGIQHNGDDLLDSSVYIQGTFLPLDEPILDSLELAKPSDIHMFRFPKEGAYADDTLLLVGPQNIRQESNGFGKPVDSPPVIGVPALHLEGDAYDNAIYEGNEEQRFPTNMWYVGTRNELLHQIVVEVRNRMTALNITDAQELPDDLKSEFLKRYADFEIACKTAVSELGFDPTELRQRTLAYRARKYDVMRMGEIRLEFMRRDREEGRERNEEELDAAVKACMKLEHGHMTSMDSELEYEKVDVSTYVAQQKLTAEWELAFTNGRGQKYEQASDQMFSELDESQAEVLQFFMHYQPGSLAAETMSEDARHHLAAEIDDVGVAGLSLLSQMGLNVEEVMEERLRDRTLRYDAQLVRSYYHYYGDMKMALEAARHTDLFLERDGRPAYQMNFFVHPAMAGYIESATFAEGKIRRYAPEVIQAFADKDRTIQEEVVYDWRTAQLTSSSVR